MRVAPFLLVGLALGCAQGGEAEIDAGTIAKDATTALDADSGPERPTDDVKPGTIFDAVEDAPCSSGAKAACVTTCGTIGDVTCVDGDWGKCAPRAGDPCAGLDCTGVGDGLEHTYYVDADGDGHAGKTTKEACAQPPGTFATSDDCNDSDPQVHPGATEVCNGKDDDCDGKTDDLPRVVGYTLPFATVPPCTTSDMASCKRGAHDWCVAKSSCFSGGFGPVELGATDGFFVCVGPGTLTGGWSDVTAAQPACNDDSQASQRYCESAVHRAGRNKGFESAILQLHAPFDWSFLGLGTDHAQMFGGVAWSEITAKHAGCVLTAVSSWDCNAAVHRWCSAKGFVSGYGPVEYNSTELAVVCVK